VRYIRVKFRNHTVTTGPVSIGDGSQQGFSVLRLCVVGGACTSFTLFHLLNLILQLFWVASALKSCFMPILVFQGETTGLPFV